MNIKTALSIFAVVLIPACALTPDDESSIYATPADGQVTPFESPGE